MAIASRPGSLSTTWTSIGSVRVGRTIWHEVERAVELGMPDSTPTTPSRGAVASGDGRRQWRSHERGARLLQIGLIVAPIALALLASFAAARYLPHERIGMPRIIWWFAMAVLTIAIVRLTERLLRRVVPLVSLLRLNLAFPDDAPNRFRAALRRPSARQLERDLESAEYGSHATQSQLLVTLIQRLTNHDPLTRGHSERVRAYSVLIGEEMGLPQRDLDKLQWAALLHDIGKLDVPAELLNKPGKPNEAEWEILRTHPAAAETYLAPLVDWLGDWRRAASEHHCRFDGTGYPASTAGRNISLAGRIVAVADAFDVMTSTRSYKKPLGADVALQELVDSSSTHFDPMVVRAMLGVGTDRLAVIAARFSWVGVLGGIDGTSGGVSSVQTAGSNLVSSGSTIVAQSAAAIIGLSTIVNPVTSNDVDNALAFVDEVPSIVAGSGDDTTPSTIVLSPDRTAAGSVASTTPTIDAESAIIAVPEQPSETTAPVVAPPTTGVSPTTVSPAGQVAPTTVLETNPLAPTTTTSTSTTTTTTTTTVAPTTSAVPNRAFGGVPHDAHQWVAAEDFDIGGEGVSYLDNGDRTPDYDPNAPELYRPNSNVDIVWKLDAYGPSTVTKPGYSIGHIRGGEWVDYTVQNLSGGTYTFEVRYAARGVKDPGGLRVYVDGELVSSVGQLQITGDWNVFDVVQMTANVPPGEDGQLRVVRIEATDSGLFDLDQFRFVN